MMARSSSPSSSWIAPFALGVATALSLVWVASQKSVVSKQKKNSTSKSSGPSLGSTSRSGGKADISRRRKDPDSSSQRDADNTAMIDSPELDNRLLRKAEAVIQWRTTRLILVIERCTNDHNYSAILRTAEALGIQHVWMIDPPVVEDEIDDPENTSTDGGPSPAVPGTSTPSSLSAASRTPQEQQARTLHHLFAQNALEWLTVRDFSSSEECVEALKDEDYQLWVTDLSQEAKCLETDPNSYCAKILPDIKVALVMGTEAVGCSQYMLDAADLRVYLPLRGFADSLNLSVATALIIHQLFVLDPTLIGAISDVEKATLREKWFTKLCQQRLLTSRQKKQRSNLLIKIRQVQTIQDKAANIPNYVLQPGEIYKINSLDTYQRQLQALEAFMDPTLAREAVQEWIDTPPEPLTDLRRADIHRVCFVGKGTKNMHSDHWKDMVATSNLQTVKGVTADFFREKVKETKTTQATVEDDDGCSQK